MKRDWIDVGRRPSGLCGAAILISARYHGFQRTTKQITGIVNVCEETIKRRLLEFSKSNAALMTKEEFEIFDFESSLNNYKELDPPCFISTSPLDLLGEKKNYIFQNQKENESIETLSKTTYPKSLNQSNNLEITNTNNKNLEKDENLSESDDCNVFLLNDDEYKLKKLIWEEVFKEWIDEQEIKSKKEKKDLNNKKSRKISKLHKEAIDPADAIKKSNKFGKKLNHNKLSELFSKTK